MHAIRQRHCKEQSQKHSRAPAASIRGKHVVSVRISVRTHGQQDDSHRERVVPVDSRTYGLKTI